MDLAVALALQLVGTASEQIMTNDAGHVPAAPGVTINSPIVQGFADAAAAGLPRPQRAEFNNYWGGFGDALNRVLDKGEDPTAAIATACKTDERGERQVAFAPSHTIRGRREAPPVSSPDRAQPPSGARSGADTLGTRHTIPGEGRRRRGIQG